MLVDDNEINVDNPLFYKRDPHWAILIGAIKLNIVHFFF